jgi:hypothetical protein
MGISRDEFWNMHLWEYNLRVLVCNEMIKAEQRKDFYRSWETAALTGQAFGGKLKRANHYIGNDDEKTDGQTRYLSDEEMDEIDAALARQDAEKAAMKAQEEVNPNV